MREATVREHDESFDDAYAKPRRAQLVAIFLAAFLLPVAVALYTGGFFGYFTAREGAGKDKLFPEATVFARQGSFLRIPHRFDLNPSPHRDWVLFAAINLRRLPQTGERLVLLSKFEGSARSKNGFAFALTGTENAVRPVVLWSGADSMERWYDFPEVEIPGRGWELFALSIQKGRYLGLHTLNLDRNEGSELKVLGGYDLEEAVLPSSDAPLIVGAALERNVRGSLGLLGIVEDKDVLSHFDKTVRSLRSNPLEIPSHLPSGAVKLWFHSGADHSSQKMVIERVDPRSGRG